MKEYTVKVFENGSRGWYLDGKYHREDGPAIECSDGTKEWWLNGEHLTEEEHKRRTSKSKVTMDDALDAGDGVILNVQAERIEELESQRNELLEALEKMVGLFEPGRVYDFREVSATSSEALKIVLAAIAKAKGE